MSRKMLIGFACLMTGLMVGCSSRPEVIRMAPPSVVDLSGRWNDTDSRMVAEQVIKECLEGNWLSEFNKKAGREPVVIVGTVVNRSDEHINPQVFIKDLEGSFINTGKVDVVASRDERVEVREERNEQNTAGYTDPATIAAIGKETGADYMLKGSLNAIKDEIKGQYAILYQVNMELVDLVSNRKVWIGQKKIKKQVTRSRFTL